MPHKAQKGLRFAEPDGAALAGDLYTPDSPGPHPVLLAAPGGGWRRGDKAQLGRWGAHLADAGIAVFAIDYRRSTAGKIWPKNLEDVTAALAFLREQGPGLGLDPERIGILGASAGAHLAALAALQEADRRPLPVACRRRYGVYDLMYWQADSQNMPPRGPDRAMLGATPPRSAAYFDASPLRQVSFAKSAEDPAHLGRQRRRHPAGPIRGVRHRAAPGPRLRRTRPAGRATLVQRGATIAPTA